jgi:hypothetical protein
MAKKEKKETIDIDGKPYDVESLSNEAKTQIINIQFVDNQILQLQNELAVADTARIGYTNALKNEVKIEIKDNS